MKRGALIVLVVIVAICGVGGYLLKGIGAPGTENNSAIYVVKKGDIVSKVVDSGTLDAVKVVELKSRASGRLKTLLKDEGDSVKTGELIAIIDPQETQLKVEQDSAQLRGAASAAARSNIEIRQRRLSAQASYDQSKSRLAQLKLESNAQPTLTTAAIAQAEAAYRSAVQDRERLRESDQPNSRSAAMNNKLEAQASYENAQREYSRQSELLRQGYVSERVVENAKLNIDVAKAKLDTATDAYNRLEKQLSADMSKANEDVRRAAAEVERAKANAIQDRTKREDYIQAIAEVEKSRAALLDVDTLIKSRDQNMASVAQLKSVLSDSQRQLRETKIVSPIDGVISKKLVQEGELVAALSGFSAGTSIVRIEDRRTLMVKLAINEIDTAKLSLGMKANITVDAFPERKFVGTVHKIAPASTALASGNQGTQTTTDTVVKYEVEIWLDKADRDLRSGMSAKCTLETQKRSSVLLIPLEYLGKDEQGSFVMFAPKSEKGKPEKKRVTTGLATGSTVEVLSGISEGDRLAKPDFTGPERKGMMEGGPG